MQNDPSILQPKITITGDLGSGKSVTSRILSSLTGYEIYSTGKVQREIARRYGMTTLELNQYAETHPEIDEEIDGVFVELNARPEGLIVDSRMAWHFMPQSFKVYLAVPVEVAAARIMKDGSRKRERYRDEQHAIDDLSARKSSENSRFLEIYGADCGDPDNFDLVIDTSRDSAETVAHAIYKAFMQWCATTVN